MRRLLLISSYFSNPVHTGGFRWTSLVRDLIERGWTFDVISQQSDNWPQHSLFNDERVTVHQVSEARWRVWLREKILQSDNTPATAKQQSAAPPPPPSTLSAVKKDTKRVLKDSAELLRDLSWTIRARRVALQLIDQHDYAAVLATSPLHLAQWVGANAAQRANVPYIADYRDPLYYGRNEALHDETLVTRLAWWLTEQYAMRRTEVAIDISEKSQWAVQAALPNKLQRPRYFIPSGYDDRAHVAKPDSQQFRIVFTGWLYPFDEIRPIFRAAAHLRDQHTLSPDVLRIDFMGTGDTHNGTPLTQIAAEFGLRDYFKQQPRQPRHIADALQQQAAVLVSFDSVTANALCVPSKLYHYAQMYGDLLLIGSADGAMAIEAAKIGVSVLPPDQQAQINAALSRAFDRWQRGDYLQVNDPNQVFHFRHSADALHTLLAAVNLYE